MNKKPINFYRFELEDGRGIYRDLDIAEGCFNFKHFHPAFNEDRVLESKYIKRFGTCNFQPFIFGFCDVKQILEWIPEDKLEGTFLRMRNRGVVCRGYAGEVVIGGHQSLIRKATARRGNKIDLKILLKRIKKENAKELLTELENELTLSLL